jgi:hypothetical protein
MCIGEATITAITWTVIIWDVFNMIAGNTAIGNTGIKDITGKTRADNQKPFAGLTGQRA